MGLWPLSTRWARFAFFAAKYWKPSGVEEAWFLWEAYSALHFWWQDIFSVFELPSHLSYYTWACYYWEELGSIIFEISLQRNLRLFVRGNSEETNPSISSQGWCVLGPWSSRSPSLDRFEGVPSCSIHSAASPGLYRVWKTTSLTFCSLGTAVSILSHN